MGRLAVIAGHTLLDAEPPPGAARRDVATPWGPAAVLEAGNHLLLQRHGLDQYVPPHAIEHRANLAALATLGVDRVLAIGSVGALKAWMAVGSFVSPNDFIALHLGISTSGAAGHRVPGFDPGWRASVVDSFKRWDELSIHDRGTYWQAIGPRFETPSEIELISASADVIGMTLAAECVIAGELGLAYAPVCTVDNLANGIGPAALTLTEYEEGRDMSRRRMREALEQVVPELAGAG
ncbi:MAG TPA: MTAP family purine nucleoside phosphorylase [Solirubrobacterales bacterium]|nr:MTAP family purine nucleoside phosphorylase [Solirubrobacterales bacterium]